MSGPRTTVRFPDAGPGAGEGRPHHGGLGHGRPGHGRPGHGGLGPWNRLCDYSEPVTGELARRESAPAGVPVIVTWSGLLTVDGDRFSAGFVAGPADRYADTLTTGHARGVQLDLTWLGARRLLGLPLNELAHRHVSVEDVWGRDGRRLLDRLSGTPGAEDRLDVVEVFLRDRLRRRVEVPPVVSGAAVLLHHHRGRLSVAELADRLGYGRQHVHRQVTRHLGLPPRTLARLLRFQAVAGAVRSGRVADLGWAGLAAAGGYADQPHLHREFRALGGLTPAQALDAWTAGRHSSNPSADVDQ